MQSKDQIVRVYDKVAGKYADKFINELQGKPMDRLLLTAFAERNKDKDKVLDMGCGPGQTTKFLANAGCVNIIGTDLSPATIDKAKALNPGISFEVADMLKLQYADKTFDAAIAFYAIVHFDYPAIKTAFAEIYRVVKNGGEFLFSFHIGDGMLHLDGFLGERMPIDFYLLDVDNVIALLIDVGFKAADTIVRYPYETEHPTKRAYVLARKN